MAKPLRRAGLPVLATLCGTRMVLARAPSIARVTAYKHYTTNSSSTVQPDDNPPAAEASRYFGHRTHKKICPSCGLPNLLPVSRCVACGEAVGDGNIRPVGQHDPLLEAVMVAKPTPKLPSREGPGLSSPQATEAQSTASRRFTGAKPSRVWHADFDTLVMDCPWPSSTSGHHVLGIIKSSRSYDIRCLNRSHLQQLDNLHAQCVEALRQSLVADKGIPTSLAVELLKQAQFGFRTVTVALEDGTQATVPRPDGIDKQWFLPGSQAVCVDDKLGMVTNPEGAVLKFVCIHPDACMPDLCPGLP
ncbi:hypothetical protein FOZ60_012956 [Perkinsus olseni]|uniref:Uncharacterized protein n=1 Tax=Perkinsus olseni TaxID=32597 RepID=A0A7J6P9V1_PEROL|nr:hypothetical protein FOZ60_012956 [Perkinsus olseni]